MADYGLTVDKLMAAGLKLLEPDAAQRKIILDAVRRAFALGADLGLESVILATTIGGRIDDWAAQKSVVLDCLGDWADVAAECGGTLAFEPHVNAIVDRPDRAIWLLEQLSHPQLMINFDYSHFEALDIPLAEALAALKAYIIGTHVKDVLGRPPDFRFLLPGEGEVDYTDYLRQISAVGFDGFITAEVSAQIFRAPDYDPVVAAHRAYQALNSAFIAAGMARQ